METGFCEDGLNCSWAHGNDELRAMARRRRPPHHSRTTPLYKTKNQAVCKLGEQGTNKGACAYAELTNERFPQSYQGPQGPTRGTRNTRSILIATRTDAVRLGMRLHALEGLQRRPLSREGQVATRPASTESPALIRREAGGRSGPPQRCHTSTHYYTRP